MWTFDAADGELLLTLAKAHGAVARRAPSAAAARAASARRVATSCAGPLLERFGAEDSCLDFSKAELSGSVPDPRVFSAWAARRAARASGGGAH